MTVTVSKEQYKVNVQVLSKLKEEGGLITETASGSVPSA
jgi:hypothetical protein